jgi:GntR family transcriptional regulator
MTTQPILRTPGNYKPLYIQIAQHLREGIRSGLYPSGSKLPSEHELMKKFDISRITAVAALDELVKERLAYRERGRGTFVAQPVVSDFSFFTSFSEDMRQRGFDTSSQALSIQIAIPDPVTQEKLKMPEETYYCLARVRLANGAPVVLQHAYLQASLYPDLEKNDFKAHYLFEIMRSVYGLNPMYGEAIVEAAAATQEEAYHLKIRMGDPVLIIWHLTLDDKYTPLEYVHSVYRSDRFSFSTGRHPLRETV